MSIKYGILPIHTIERLILMTEAAQAFVHRKSVDELIEDGEMPHVYFELIAAKENAWDLESSEHDYKDGTSKMKLTRPSGIRIAEPDKTIEE
jgi:hypothetical protein